jgi:hypothetical protein
LFQNFSDRVQSRPRAPAYRDFRLCEMNGRLPASRWDHAVAKYALEGLPNKVLAAEYRMTLPQERLLAEEIERTRRHLDTQREGVPQARQRARLRGTNRLRRLGILKAAEPNGRSRDKF